MPEIVVPHAASINVLTYYAYDSDGNVTYDSKSDYIISFNFTLPEKAKVLRAALSYHHVYDQKLEMNVVTSYNGKEFNGEFPVNETVDKMVISFRFVVASVKKPYYEPSTTHVSNNYVNDIALTVYYDTDDGKCKPPTSARMSETMAKQGDDVELTWSGAQGSLNNSIIGYDVEYSDTTDVSNWGSWKYLASTSEARLVVNPGDTGVLRRYRIRTKGTAGDAYYSGWFNVVDMLYCMSGTDDPISTKCTPPVNTSIAKDTVTVDGELVRISFTGANGGNNNFIAGYTVQYCENKDQVWSSWRTLKTVSTEYADVNAGEVGVYRKFRVRTDGSIGGEYNSQWVMVDGMLYHAESQSDLPDWPENPDNPQTGDTVVAHNNMMPNRAVFMWRRIE